MTAIVWWRVHVRLHAAAAVAVRSEMLGREVRRLVLGGEHKQQAEEHGETGGSSTRAATTAAASVIAQRGECLQHALL